MPSPTLVLYLVGEHAAVHVPTTAMYVSLNQPFVRGQFELTQLTNQAAASP